MKRSTLALGLFLSLLVGALLLAWQWRAVAQQRVELIRLRLQQEEMRSLQAANERLAAEVPLDELEALRRDRAELLQLQEAMGALDARQQAEAKAAAEKLKHTLPPLEQPMRSAATWTFAGNATPDAALESMLWSAAHGQHETLTTLLHLDSTGRKKLHSSTKLPPAHDPEVAFAAFIGGQLQRSIGTIGIVGESEWTTHEKFLRVRVQTEDGTERDTTFRVRRGESGGWSVTVPSHMVDSFTKSLRPAEAETADD